MANINTFGETTVTKLDVSGTASVNSIEITSKKSSIDASGNLTCASVKTTGSCEVGSIKDSGNAEISGSLKAGATEVKTLRVTDDPIFGWHEIISFKSCNGDACDFYASVTTDGEFAKINNFFKDLPANRTYLISAVMYVGGLNKKSGDEDGVADPYCISCPFIIEKTSDDVKMVGYSVIEQSSMVGWDRDNYGYALVCDKDFGNTRWFSYTYQEHTMYFIPKRGVNTWNAGSGKIDLDQMSSIEPLPGTTDRIKLICTSATVI